MFTPESFDLRIQAWKASPGAVLFPCRTPEEIAQRRVGDAERAAIKILDYAMATIEHPFLEYWLDLLVSDPSYHMSFQEFMNQPKPDLYASVHRVVSKRRGDRWSLDDAAKMVERFLADGFGCSDNGPTYPEPSANYQLSDMIHKQDRAAYTLASQIVEHRLYGEEGETTSLFDALVQYHMAVAGALILGDRTTLPFTRHITIPGVSVLVWENDQVEIRTRKVGSETHVYLLNKGTKETMCVTAVPTPQYNGEWE